MKKKMADIVRILKRYNWEYVFQYYHKHEDKCSLIVGKNENRMLLTSDYNGNMISCHYIAHIAK